MDHRNAIYDLLAAYLNRQLSRAEFDRLFSHLAELEDDDFKDAVLMTLESQPDTADSAFIPQRLMELYPRLQSKLQEATSVAAGPHTGIRRNRRVWWSVSAAAILVFVLAGSYLFNDAGQRKGSLAITPEQVLPGGNRATLTLADGRTIDLSSEQAGIIVNDGITYLDGSRLIDNGDTPDRAPSTVHHQLSTPKGGQYQITLIDGTRVWLNAASTLTYPATFDGNVREVALQGEACFEVSKDRAKPFIVKTAKQRVEVLGTTFNINAYDNETATKTTLLSGSVHVHPLNDDQGKRYILHPNQQSIIGSEGSPITVREVDAQTAIAWKAGLFNFHGLTIDESLKQIERWYDVTVHYEGKRPEGYLGGKMSRGVRLSTFLDFLEKDYRIKAELKKDRTLVLHTL